MPDIFGDIDGYISMAPGQSIRRKLDDSAFEAYDPPSVSAYSQSSATRSLNSAFVPSSTRNVLASYSVDIAATLSLSGGQSGTVFLEISANGTTGWTTIAQFTNANAGSLTIGLNVTQTNTAMLAGTIPAGYSARLRTANNTGTPTFTYRCGQETTI